MSGTAENTQEKPAVVELDKPVSTPGPELPKWASKRIDGLTTELYAEKAAKKDLEARLAALEKAKEGAGGEAAKEAPAGLSEKELKERIQREASALAEQIAFNKECNKSFEKGASEFSDFKEKIADLRNTVGIPTHIVQAVMELDDPHKVFYALAQDKDRAEEINAMSPTRAAVALAKFATEAGKKPKGGKARSDAPEPIGDGAVRGSAGAGEAALDDGRLSMAEFVKRREADMKARKGRFR